MLRFHQRAPPSPLSWQELTGQLRNELKTKYFDQEQPCYMEHLTALMCKYYNSQCTMDPTMTECLRAMNNRIEIQDMLNDFSGNSTSSINCSKVSSSFSSLIKIFRNHDSTCSTSYDRVNIRNGLFGERKTEVYMSLFNDFGYYHASGTQATALINKCLQVNSKISNRCDASTLDVNYNCDSIRTLSTTISRQSRRPTMENRQYHNVYFFGRKKDSSKSSGMGYKESKTKIHRTGETSNTPGRSASFRAVNAASVQTQSSKGASTATSTTKAVSIKEDKPKKPCPAAGQTKGDMMATISHVRIGPREPCPVHGKEPCQGPKCIIASSGEEQAPVKVSTVTNPRRGVFEIVIRKMTGAPLAKNEFMLEWTPPPSRPPPCGGPCPIPCTMPTPCRPTKCKMIVCRPSKCLTKCRKNPCKIPCKKFCKVSCCKVSCCKVPCSKVLCSKVPCCKVPCCKVSCSKVTCGSKKCIPCGPTPCSMPCATPCCALPCSSSCKSSPCLRPCPVGRKRPRKAHSQPKIKAHRKLTSPCLNRSKTCPVVRCRSMPAPCVGCCTISPFCISPCPPRKYCSVAPCKPPKCCKSSCSQCCP